MNVDIGSNEMDYVGSIGNKRDYLTLLNSQGSYSINFLYFNK